MATRQKTRRGIGLAVAASAVVLAGLVWGAGLFDLSATTDAGVAGSPEDRNAGEVNELMTLYAEDAVVTDHPLDYGDAPVATGVEEIRLLEVGVPGIQRAENALEYLDVQVSGNQATFVVRFFNAEGECFGGSRTVAVEGGKITRYEWGEEDDQPCAAGSD